MTANVHIRIGPSDTFIISVSAVGICDSNKMWFCKKIIVYGFVVCYGYGYGM